MNHEAGHKSLQDLWMVEKTLLLGRNARYYPWCVSLVLWLSITTTQVLKYELKLILLNINSTQWVSMWLELFPSTSRMQFIILTIEHFFKLFKAKVTRNVTTLTTPNFIMTEIICQHNSLQVILTDNMTKFIFRVITNLANFMGSHQDFSASYNSSINKTLVCANGT